MKLKAYERLIACEQVTSKWVLIYWALLQKFGKFYMNFEFFFIYRESEERSVQFQELLDKNLRLKQKLVKKKNFSLKFIPLNSLLYCCIFSLTKQYISTDGEICSMKWPTNSWWKSRTWKPKTQNYWPKIRKSSFVISKHKDFIYTSLLFVIKINCHRRSWITPYLSLLVVALEINLETNSFFHHLAHRPMLNHRQQYCR